MESKQNDSLVHPSSLFYGTGGGGGVGWMTEITLGHIQGQLSRTEVQAGADDLFVRLL